MATILVVDDRPTNREYLATLLGYSGHRILEAADGQTGLELAQAERPDLILTDIVMPTMDGYEFTRQVRADPSIRHTQVVFFTSSYVVAETRQLAAACGVAHIIAKPAEPQDILAMVNSALATQPVLLPVELSEGFHREHMRLLTDTLAKKVDELEADIVERRRAEAAAARSEAELRALFGAMTDIVLVLDGQGRYLQIAPTNPALLVRPPAELIGRTVHEVLPADEADEVLRNIRAALEQQQPVHVEYGLAIRGTRLWFDGTVSPMGSDRVFWISRDITARKLAEEAVSQSEQRYRLLFDSNPMPMWVYARETLRFLAVNDAAIEHYGYSRGEFLDMTLFDLRSPAEAPRLDANLAAPPAALEKGGIWTHRKKDGGLISMEIVSHSLAFDGHEARLVLAQDLTERLKRERELEAVAAVSAAVRTAQTLEALLAVWLDVTLGVMQASGGSIWLHDPAKDELRPVVIRGWTQPAGAPAPQPQKPGVGVNGHVFVTGQAYLSKDFQQDPHLAEDASRRIPPGGGASLPIRVGDTLIGTFVVNLPPGRELAASDVHLLTTLADIAGSAIHRMRLYEETEQRLAQLSALREIDRAIMGSLDLQLTLVVLLEQVTAKLAVDAAAVLLFDAATATLNHTAGRGFRTRSVPPIRLRLGESYAGRAALEQRVVQASNLLPRGAEFQADRRLAAEAFVSYVGAPLIAKGKLLGVLEVFHRAPLAVDPSWLDFLEALAGQAAIAIENAALFKNQQSANLELQLAYDATIEGWSRALDLRDKETEGHSQRVTDLTMQLAQNMGLSDEGLVHARRGALLHDIGKMAIPDHILLKPGPLTSDERTIMRQHPALAYAMLAPIQYLQPALAIPYCHHEKWDGSGYPRGLPGDQIPLAARLFAVVDVWDALRSDRPYRAAWPAEKVRDHIREQSGQHFDPAVVTAFLSMDLRGPQ